MNQIAAVTNSEDASESAFDLLALYHSFLERKWIIIGCLGATLLLGLLYIFKTPKTYEAITVVQVEQSEDKVVLIQDVQTQDLKTTEILNTIQTNLVSPPVLAGVIDALKLDAKTLGLSPRSDPPYSQPELITQLTGQIKAVVQRGTRLIQISTENTDPALAKKEAEEVVKQYIRIDMSQRAGVTGAATTFLAAEATRLKVSLEAAEREVQAFKDQHPGIALEDSQQFIDSKVLALTTRLNDARSDTFKLASDDTQVRKILGSDLSDSAKARQVLAISSVSNNPNVLQLQKTIGEQEGEFGKLKERYTPMHPKFAEMKNQIAGLRAELDKAILQASETVGSALAAARQTEANIESLLKDLELEKLKIDRLAIPFAAYTREADSYRDLYVSVQARLKETAITQEINTNNLRVVTPALMPDLPVKPQKLLVVIASVIGGLLLGFCVSFALSATDKSFRTVDQIEQALGLPMLAVVPIADKVVAHGQALLILREPQSAVAEGIRTLRASLSMREAQSEHTRFLFTSSVPGEGKTFCSSNFAVSLAQLGLRTLLIDADLRLPAISKEFFRSDDSPGVAGVLRGTATLQEAIRPSEVANLSVLTAGERIRNPAELLTTADFGELLRKALVTYQRVVIDSAPVHAVSDTMLLVRYVESVCLVVRAGKTPRRAVQRAVQILTEGSARPVGVILNRASPHQGAGYYYYYSAGKYGEEVYAAAS